MKEFTELKKLLVLRRELARQQMEFWKAMMNITPMSELKLTEFALLEHWRGRYSMCKKAIVMVENWLSGCHNNVDKHR